MADDDELLRHALAVVGPTLAAQITRGVSAERQFPALLRNGSFNTAFAGRYITVVQQALRLELEQQLRDVNGDLTNEQRQLASTSTDIAGDATLSAAVTQYIQEEAPRWPAGTEAA